MTAGWETPYRAWPKAPMNGQIVGPISTGIYDLRWDNPATLGANAIFTLSGVNIYRSDVGERGPYFRINHYPIGGNFYRDKTQNVLISCENIFWNSSWHTKGDGPNDRDWVFRTRFPIIDRNEEKCVWGNSPLDVSVCIDNQPVIVDSVFGRTGEVRLINYSHVDPVTEKMIPPVLPSENSTVLVSYYTNKNFVETGLEKKVWYRITSVGFLSDNPAVGLFETPLDYCQPLIHYSTEALDYIWREAIRRNNWILEQGGERVYFFIRKTAGIPCRCSLDERTLEYNQMPRNNCHLCFVPGTLVRTKDGYRPIESIKVGEEVLTSSGEFFPVISTFERPFKGDLCGLRASISTNPILVTPDHPFLTIRGSHRAKTGCGPKCDKYIEKGDGLVKSLGSVRQLHGGNWWTRVPVQGSRGTEKTALGTYPTKEEAEEAVNQYVSGKVTPEHFLAWEEAENLTEKDWLVSKWPSLERDVKEIHVPLDFLGDPNSRDPQRFGCSSFVVDEEFLWIVGRYLAEGSSVSGSLQFFLNSEETEYQDRILRYFQDLGYNPSVSFPKGKSAVVHINCSILSEWFPWWLGRGCQDKKIPEELMYLPAEKTWSLIKGVYDGDDSDRDHEITHTSEILALQLSELLHRVGEQPLIRTQISQVLTPKETTYCVSWAEDTQVHNNRKGRWSFWGDVLAKVQAMNRVPYEGPVYNLEVAGDHTYVVNGVVTHNCYGTGYLGGYEGPYNGILVPDEADRRISQTDKGRRLELSYEVWMGPTPLLTMRDFVVKQTNERFSIGAIRRPTNRGNLLQQHFTIAYLSESDIRYKVPLDNLSELPFPQNRITVDPRETLLVYPIAEQGPAIEATPDEHSPEVYPSNAEYKSHPMISEKDNIDDSRERRGRTIVYSNQNY